MIISSILSTLKTFLDSSGILSARSTVDYYEVQITPDERPLPNSGGQVITLYPISLVRKTDKEQRSYIPTIELCATRRITFSPHDRQYLQLYTELITSLSSMIEFLGLAIDSNNSLINTIKDTIESNRDTSVTHLTNLSVPPSSELLVMYSSTTAIGPLLSADFIIRPIPRFDDFFTAFSTKRDYEPRTADDRIQPSGYSMKLTIRGPEVIVNRIC